MKRFLEWIHFDDLDQVDKDIYAHLETSQQLKVLFTTCPTCSA
jgi:hypothetical protein